MSYITHKDLVDGDKEDEDAQYLMSNLIIFQPLINPLRMIITLYSTKRSHSLE